MLIRYIRDAEGNPVGVGVAVGKNQVGFSFCHPKDRFDKELGKHIATARAIRGAQARIPYRYERQVMEVNLNLLTRSVKYFK